jgi:homoaconitase/3-isopropylmalate dehydratase large subunit
VPSEETFVTLLSSSNKNDSEGAQMSSDSDLESDGAMVVNLEQLEPMVLAPMKPRPSRQVRQTRSEGHVSGHSDSTFPA